MFCQRKQRPGGKPVAGGPEMLLAPCVGSPAPHLLVTLCLQRWISAPNGSGSLSWSSTFSPLRVQDFHNRPPKLAWRENRHLGEKGNGVLEETDHSTTATQPMGFRFLLPPSQPPCANTPQMSVCPSERDPVVPRSVSRFPDDELACRSCTSKLCPARFIFLYFFHFSFFLTTTKKKIT